MYCPEITDLKYDGINKHTKDIYYRSETIEHIWGKGRVEIGSVTTNSIQYTTGYTAKKLFGDLKIKEYAERGREPIFALMSRNPGIGIEIKNKKNLYITDKIINSKGIEQKVPNYIDKKYDYGTDEEHKLIKAVKQIRAEKSQNYLIKKMKNTNVTIKEQLEIEERTLKEKQRLYNRGRIK